MAGIHHFVLGAVVMVMISLPAVYAHECDCSKYTQGGNGCSTYTAAVQQCVMASSQMPPNVDVAMICRMHNETKVCMAAAAGTCDNPPADSKTWTDMWAKMDSTAQQLCSHGPGDTSCGNFEAQAATCLLAMNEAEPGSSMDEICQIFRETKLCMDPLITKCPGEAQGSQINSVWQMMKQQMDSMPC